MILNFHLSKLFPARRWLNAGLLVLGLLAATGAQAAIEQRWLFIFDTSSGMKKRLPAVETQIVGLLTKDFAKSLREGDSIGVWTFDEKLHMGRYPLVIWDPNRAVMLASNLVTFVRKQSYAGNTSFGVLQPTLESVIQDSDRLTVVIVCDGEGEIQWTPYNDGMNEAMRQTREDRKKIKQPYILVLRTQLGKYVGATVNFPPLAATLPPFPLLPSELKPVPVPVPAVVPAPKPPPPAPSLVIVGTHVSSDTNDVTKFSAANQMAAAVEKSNAAAALAAATPSVMHATPAANVPEARVPATNVLASAPANGLNAVQGTNSAASAAGGDDRDTRILTYVGVGLLGAAVALVIFLIARGRPAPRSSLITTSMQSNPRPPEQK